MSDAVEAFFRLLHEYVADSDERRISPYHVEFNLDELFDRLERRPEMYIGCNEIRLLRTYISSSLSFYFEGYAACAAEQHLDDRDPSWWSHVSTESPTNKRMYSTIATYRTMYRGTPYEMLVFNGYLAKRYGDSRSAGWDTLISDYEGQDAIPAFFRLLREYATEWKKKNN